MPELRGESKAGAFLQSNLTCVGYYIHVLAVTLDLRWELEVPFSIKLEAVFDRVRNKRYF